MHGEPSNLTNNSCFVTHLEVVHCVPLCSSKAIFIYTCHVFGTRAQYFEPVIKYTQNCRVERNKKHKTWFHKTEAETMRIGSSWLTPPGLNNPSIILVRLWHVCHQFMDLTSAGGLSRPLAARHAMCWNTRMKLAVLKIVTTSITLSKSSLANSRCWLHKKQEMINLTRN